MKNQEIAKIFYKISEYLEMDEVAFRPYAYNRAALTLDNLDQNIEEIYKEKGLKGLKEIPGIGEHLALKIEEYLKTGKIKYYEKLKKESPIDVSSLTAIESLGPKKIKTLYQKLGIRNVKQLEKAAKAHKIAPLFGFGEKTEQNILQGIEFLKKEKGRFLLAEILPTAQDIYKKLKKLKEVEKIDIVGSLKRMRETIRDVDILVASKRPKKVMDFFITLDGIEKVWSKGTTKASIRMKEGFDVDIRVVPRDSYGSALQYFIGSKEHNIATRKIAIKKGLKLNEYGLFKGRKKIAGKDEKQIYELLGMAWVPPEMRENQGEIELALKDKLPELIELKDIKGDLHCHSDWNGGENSILEMAKKAISLEYQYIGISDHTKFLRIENGLNEKQLLKQRKEIDRLNEKFKRKKSKFRILQGAETNILKDGSIDIKDEALEKLDYVIAGIHSSFKMKKDEMTDRMIKAMKNPHIDIISHPTGRLLKKREQYEIDFDKIIKTAKEYGVILEINSHPVRLDLNGQNIRRCKKAGVKMVINADSHHRSHMRYVELGVAQARRGWAEKKDIINARPLNKLLEYFK
ncbi:MAG: DNA polymerase/3'-5' exonuclease PolX [Patescibacteria group bacterium]|nr:DNA polymerase/3'-5' exonuclease PolX [Patescibacteria group bacterium]